MATPSRVTIVGAGIGGLTLAVALRRLGIPLDLHEQAVDLGEDGAGIQLPPNATTLLARLGCLEPVLARGFVPRAIEMRRWDDDALLGVTELGDECVHRFGAPYITVSRAHLHQVLVEAAGPELLRLGRRCTRIEQGSEYVDLEFDDGARISRSLVVGADGIRSAVRSAVTEEVPPRFTGRIAHRGLIARKDLAASLDCVTIWLGPGAHLVAYPIDRDTLSLAAPISSAHGEEVWRRASGPQELRAAYCGWNPRVQALIAGAACRTTTWGLHDRPSPRRLVRGRVALLGDAAHPMLPFGAQGAAQAIEDAAVLAGHVSQGYATAVSALAGYEAERLPRIRRVFDYIQGNSRDHHLSDGDQQGDRDSRLAARVSLDGLSWLFGHASQLTMGGAA